MGVLREAANAVDLRECGVAKLVTCAGSWNNFTVRYLSDPIQCECRVFRD